ncbi:Outer membrane protein A [Ephemeroptericola cinctiostellae]|uniref:Outer membrane protein A n=1 Tax=Ephemeroptericola cinctiostellae TaxID=2268024 RepID=A0A345DA56_9BURK|nr:OmpA family protein [Ephemeroptericola cinctiostellae]AXF85244.1 Outer membrane protein A [Ephemeroptericola cinctiostellae]
MNRYTKKTVVALGLIFGLGLSMVARAGLSEVTDQGTTDKPVFPEVKAAWIQDGRYPNLDNLSKIHSGMTRDQIMALIEYPIFSEGFRVREWDYLFHFQVADGQGGTRVDSCLYKVLFDKNKLAQSFYWKPVSEHAVCPAQAASVATAVAAAAAEPMNLTLSADALFPFNKFSAADLNDSGRQQLNRFAQMVRDSKRDYVLQVTAYTDRIGSDAANFRLSQRRASTIKAHLVGQGVKAAAIQAVGAGESNPVVSCSSSLARAALITCLQPNRRVTIEAK